MSGALSFILPTGQFYRSLLLMRSEEHTSELQSQSNLVCRLLLEKKKYNNYPFDDALYQNLTIFGVPSFVYLFVNGCTDLGSEHTPKFANAYYAATISAQTTMHIN